MFYKLINYLTNNLKYIIILYVAIQLLLVLFLPIEYRSDSARYFNLAQDCLQANSFYPASQHLYSYYILAPLYLNILVVLLNISNSIFIISIFNLLLNSLQLFLIYKLSVKIFNKNVAAITVLLYIFYLNNLGFLVSNLTELLFGVLVLAAFIFYLRKGNLNGFICGLFIGASISVKPVGYTLLLAVILFFIYSKIKFNKSYPVIWLISGVITFISVFGLFNQLHFGRFIFTASTGPINIIMGANDNATGGYKDEVFKPGNEGYLANGDSMTYSEKNDFYTEKSLDWITSNPLRWLRLMPMKLLHTFIWDDITVSYLLDTGDWDFAKIVKYLWIDKSFKNILPDATLTKKILFFAIEGIHLIYYYILIALCIIGIIIYKKNILKSEIIPIIILYVLLGIVMILIVVGNVRFKYPYLIILLPFAANYIYQLTERVKKKDIA
ncbi:MAG: glycosyltransferase family 39 protein [Ignavibacteriaceae bacterium]